MARPRSPNRSRFAKLRRRRRGWPVGTVATYGPNDKRATKMVAAILANEDAEPFPMRTWIVEEGDVRVDEAIHEELFAFLEENGVKRVVSPDRIIGCPHQEGIDYTGPTCPDPACEFWIGIDRFTGSRRTVARASRRKSKRRRRR